jgi:hypothetical protein
MENKNKAHPYATAIVIMSLSGALIVLGIAYNSLRNENQYLGQEVSYLESYISDDAETFEDVIKRLSKLESAVFKKSR